MVLASTNILDGTIGARAAAQVAAMPIRSFVEPGAFEPEAIAVMSEAFEAAVEELQDTTDVMREVIARRIIAEATLGERDPVRLGEAALAGLKGRRS
jgi:hypothetical protein